MQRFLASLVAIVLALSLPVRVEAWGPFTHVAIGKAALACVRAEHGSPLSFLLTEPARSVFLASSMGPDMTFSVIGFGKTDRHLDSLLHSDRTGRRLVQDALKANDAVSLAFGLGWYGHRIADIVMCRRGSVVNRNVFDLKDTSRLKLGHDGPGMLKVAVDAILARADPHILSTLPRCDVKALARVLRAEFPHEVAGGAAELEEQLETHSESFAGSIATLREVCRTFSANRKAFPAMAAELTGVPPPKLGPVPGIADAAQAVYETSLALVPSHRELGVGPGLVPEPQSPSGLWDRVTASFTRHSRSLLAGHGLASRMTRRALNAALSAMNRLGVARERTRRARVMATFLGEMLSDQRDWEGVKAAVREVAEESEPATDPGAEEDAPLEGAP